MQLAQETPEERSAEGSEATPFPEKRCLDCGAVVTQQFCGQCGQEAKPSLLPVGELLRDVWEEFFKWDNRLLATLSPLLLRPGLLTQEYLRGRRTRYISPFKLYFSISALWFLLFTVSGTDQQLAMVFRQGMKPGSEPTASVLERQPLPEDGAKAGPSRERSSRDAQDSPPEEKRVAEGEEGLERAERVQERVLSGLRSGMEWYLTNTNLLMFFMVPVMAGILKLLYLRSGRLYVEHLILAVHVNAWSFLVFFLMFIPSLLFWVNLLGILGGWAYQTLAMRRVYGQGWGKTLLKSTLFQGAYYGIYFAVVLAVLALFALFSAWPLINRP